MANGTGNGYWIVKWLVGALWGVVVIIGLAMNTTVRANDNKATKEHTEIRKEIVVGDDKTEENLTKELKETNQKITKGLKETNQKVTTMLVQQTRMLTILEQIKDK